jgi:hypothetical protein
VCDVFCAVIRRISAKSTFLLYKTTLLPATPSPIHVKNLTWKADEREKFHATEIAFSIKTLGIFCTVTYLYAKHFTRVLAQKGHQTLKSIFALLYLLVQRPKMSLRHIN